MFFRRIRALGLLVVLCGFVAMPFQSAFAQEASPVAQPTESDDVSAAAVDQPVTFTVTMSDGGATPYGLTWALFLSGNWTPLQSGDVPGNTASGWSIVLPDLVSEGTYEIWITGNGYSSGQVFVVAGPANVGINLVRITGNLLVTMDTADDAVIPAGTSWSVEDANGDEVQSGTLAASLPDGSTLPIANPVEYGTYTVTIDAPGYASFSQVVNLTDPWNSTLAITADLVLLSYPITVGINMSDGGTIPYGLSWTLYPDGSWTPLQTGDVPGGVASGWSIVLPDEVPAGVYGLWITGNGYSSGQAISAPAFPGHTFTLDRLIGNVTVTLDTDDDGVIPAGSTWALADSNGVTIQSGTLAADLPDGSTLPLTNPIEYGTYSLTVEAIGYFDLTMPINVTDPWNADVAVTANLIFESYPITLGVNMSDGGAIPYGLTWSLFPDGSWTPLQTGDVPGGAASGWSIVLPDEVTPGTYQLWITGNGYSSGQVISAPDFPGHTFTLDRLLGNLTVTLDTSDDEVVPAGSTWSLADVNGIVVDSGTLAADLPDGSTLPLANPIEYGLYTLTISAAGYQPFALPISLTDPWNANLAVTAELIAIPATSNSVMLTVETVNGADIPAGTIITVGGVAYVVPETDADAVSAASIASGSAIEFPEVPLGTQPVTATNAAPFADYASTIEVTAGDGIEATIVLQLAETPVPTAPGNATPIATVTPPATGPSVTTLPNTGQGAESREGFNVAILAIVGAMVLVLAAGAMSIRVRRPRG